MEQVSSLFKSMSIAQDLYKSHEITKKDFFEACNTFAQILSTLPDGASIPVQDICPPQEGQTTESENLMDIFVQNSQTKHYADCVILVNNKLFICQRSNNDDFMAGKWCLPGGKIEKGQGEVSDETNTQAVKREVFEETGIVLKDVRYLALYKNSDGSFTHYFETIIPEENGFQVRLESDEIQHYELIDLNEDSIDRFGFILDLGERLKKLLNINVKRLVSNEQLESSANTNPFVKQDDDNEDYADNVLTDGPDKTLQAFEQNELKKAEDALIIIEQAFNDDLIDSQQYLQAIQSYEILKSHVGVYSDTAQNRSLKRVGQKYGSKKQEEATQQKEGTGKKEKPKKQHTGEELVNHAKNAPQTELERVVKESDDPKLREAAHKELQRRSKEEVPQEEKEKPKEEKPKEAEQKKEALDEEKVKQYEKAFENVSLEQLKFYLNAPNLEVVQAAKNIMKYNEKKSDLVSEKYKNIEVQVQTDEFSDEEKLKFIDLLGLPGDIEGKANIKKDDGNNSVYIDFDSDKIKLSRQIFKKTNNIKNHFFEIKDKTLSGSDVFNNQVQEAKKQGFSKLKTLASGGVNSKNEYNGYYTWARLGYTEQNSDDLSDTINKFSKDFNVNVKSLSDIMSTKEGRDWWKKNGETFDGEFDLSDDSYSMKTLKNYINEKANKS